MTEGGTTTYTVVLDPVPTADVTITLNAGNQLSLDQTVLTFTPADFNIAQTVTVTAIDDLIGEGPHRGVITATVTSSDLNYDGITVANVVAQITDNDIPQKDPVLIGGGLNVFGLENVGSYAAPTFADIDEDGDLDAFVGNTSGDTVFFENTGSASAPAFASHLTSSFDLASMQSYEAPACPLSVKPG